MAIRLSCADYAWPALSHPTVLSVIRDLGYEGVDIGVFADVTHVTVPSVVARPKERAAEVLDDVRAAGLVVADVFLTSSLELGRLTPTSRTGDDVAQLRSIFAAVIEFAQTVGSSGITLLPGVTSDGQSVADGVLQAAEGLAPLVAMGADSGLGVSVEPHLGSCIESPAATAQLLDACPGLTVTLDPSHFAYQGFSVDEMLRLLPRSRHIQIRPGGPGVMQAKVPDNQIDLPLLVDRLVEQGYSGWMASEFVWMSKWSCDEVDNTAESARLGDLMRSLLARRKAAAQ